MTRITQVAGVLLIALSGLHVTTATAQTSFHMGWASEYYFRGIFQQRSSAFAGVNYSQRAIEANGRLSDVGNGLEARGLVTYSVDVQPNLTIGGGFQGFYYTGDTDESFGEFLASATFRPSRGRYSFEFLYSLGEWNGLGNSDADTEDDNDDFFSVTWRNDGGRFRGLYATYGLVGFEYDNDYLEVGFGTRASGIDLSIAAIFNGIQLTDPDDGAVGNSFTFSDDEALVLTLQIPF